MHLHISLSKRWILLDLPSHQLGLKYNADAEMLIDLFFSSKFYRMYALVQEKQDVTFNMMSLRW
jgi:hypothetical protein